MENPAEDDMELQMLLETLCEDGDTTPTPDKTSSSIPPTVPKYRDISIETFLKPQNTVAPVEELVKSSSLIHSGDTDSSDDEDNKYGTNFNTFGKEIKKMLDIKEKLIADKNILTDNKTQYNSTASSQCNVLKPKVPVQPKAKEPTKSGAQDCYSEPISGIRVINPLISYQTMGQRMIGRKFVGISRLKDEIERQQLNEDWITIGVIVSSSPVKTSQKKKCVNMAGSKYIIWKMSDLKGDLKTISLFLFSGAYKAFWKTTTSVVVGVLNPNIMDKRDDKGEAALSVDVPQKLLIIGKSKDLGFCKSKKKDGTNCTAFVNTDTCSVCIYHAQQEYKKCAQRPGLQAPGSHNLSALRNKVLGKNEVFYAGQSYSAIPAKKSKKLEMKDNLRLNQLSGQKANQQ
ncbi:hypothetical protein B566_EDAN007301 [Ephemera danica]|nr:hypothetical protein B566_EDAN007301 [Ephemera danica]